jgi:DNA-binding transcriptional LysR family regulator
LDHPLEGRESVSLHSLAGETFVDFQPDQGTRRIVDRAFAAINVSRKTALEVGDVQVLLDLVARGFGIALVPYTLAMARAAIATPKIGITALRKPAIRWDLVAAFSGRAGTAQSRNPAVAAFTEVLEKVRAATILS